MLIFPFCRHLFKVGKFVKSHSIFRKKTLEFSLSCSLLEEGPPYPPIPDVSHWKPPASVSNFTKFMHDTENTNTNRFQDLPLILFHRSPYKSTISNKVLLKIVQNWGKSLKKWNSQRWILQIPNLLTWLPWLWFANSWGVLRGWSTYRIGLSQAHPPCLARAERGQLRGARLPCQCHQILHLQVEKLIIYLQIIE